MILEERRPGPRERLDLARGAADAWLHPHRFRVPALAALVGGGLWTFAAAAVIAQPTPRLARLHRRCPWHRLRARLPVCFDTGMSCAPTVEAVASEPSQCADAGRLSRVDRRARCDGRGRPRCPARRPRRLGVLGPRWSVSCSSGLPNRPLGSWCSAGPWRWCALDVRLASSGASWNAVGWVP